MTNKTKDIVKYGEVFSTPTGNNRKRNNLVLNIDGEGIEQVVGQYEEKLTPAKKIETAAERTRRKTANRGKKRSGIPSRKEQHQFKNSEAQRQRLQLMDEKVHEKENERSAHAMQQMRIQKRLTAEIAHEEVSIVYHHFRSSKQACCKCVVPSHGNYCGTK